MSQITPKPNKNEKFIGAQFIAANFSSSSQSGSGSGAPSGTAAMFIASDLKVTSLEAEDAVYTPKLSSDKTNSLPITIETDLQSIIQSFTNNSLVTKKFVDDLISTVMPEDTDDIKCNSLTATTKVVCPILNTAFVEQPGSYDIQFNSRPFRGIDMPLTRDDCVMWRDEIIDMVTQYQSYNPNPTFNSVIIGTSLTVYELSSYGVITCLAPLNLTSGGTTTATSFQDESLLPASEIDRRIANISFDDPTKDIRCKSCFVSDTLDISKISSPGGQINVYGTTIFREYVVIMGTAPFGSDEALPAAEVDRRISTAISAIPPASSFPSTLTDLEITNVLELSTLSSLTGNAFIILTTPLRTTTTTFSDNELVTKEYVDQAIAANGGGGGSGPASQVMDLDVLNLLRVNTLTAITGLSITSTSPITTDSSSFTDNQLVPKSYVDTALASFAPPTETHPTYDELDVNTRITCQTLNATQVNAADRIVTPLTVIDALTSLSSNRINVTNELLSARTIQAEGFTRDYGTNVDSMKLYSPLHYSAPALMTDPNAVLPRNQIQTMIDNAVASTSKQITTYLRMQSDGTYGLTTPVPFVGSITSNIKAANNVFITVEVIFTGDVTVCVSTSDMALTLSTPSSAETYMDVNTRISNNGIILEEGQLIYDAIATGSTHIMIRNTSTAVYNAKSGDKFEQVLSTPEQSLVIGNVQLPALALILTICSR
jgi:hypothetical protein